MNIYAISQNNKMIFRNTKNDSILRRNQVKKDFNYLEHSFYFSLLLLQYKLPCIKVVFFKVFFLNLQFKQQVNKQKCFYSPLVTCCYSFIPRCPVLILLSILACIYNKYSSLFLANSPS